MKYHILRILITASVLLNIILLINPCLFLKCTTQNQRKAYNRQYYDGRKSLFEILPKNYTDILFLGNSITDGVELHELFDNCNVKNRGINADTIEGIQERLVETLSVTPSKIFLLIGTNDLKYHSTSKIIIDYQKLLEKIKELAPSSRLFIQSILPVIDTELRSNKDINEINTQLKNICSNWDHIEFIDLTSALKDSNGQLESKYTYDGLHLNGTGYLKWKTVIEKYLKI
ncbi:hypothetical protein BFP77_14030 [Maribacter sp. 4U21]|uniref:GDSL-type esterase/lipase family protein n=1 Tax=Maribacter sp. 4U21 TaxID=1889779 RepID=UPI000C15F8DC|nr:GDSL-type esterase/lipase family protein [Maribacter sp. 4U21]PIB27145.1 hypothetical protein BFP77_14030 [Maribacter sp. 4U21]